MWNLLGKSNENNEGRSGQRIHVDQTSGPDLFRRQLTACLQRTFTPPRSLAVLCIGTDRSTGDCLGPLVGSKLAATLPPETPILGTLEHPVHAVNLSEAIEELQKIRPRPFVIAVDACLGRTESVGYISLKEGPLQPGTGVNKVLPPVGDLHVIGIVNVGGFMEYLVLQNTRLSLVMRMAELIAHGIREVFKSLPEQAHAGLTPNLTVKAEIAAAIPEPIS